MFLLFLFNKNVPMKRKKKKKKTKERKKRGNKGVGWGGGSLFLRAISALIESCCASTHASHSDGGSYTQFWLHNYRGFRAEH